MLKEVYLELLKNPITRSNLTLSNWSADNRIIGVYNIKELDDILKEQAFVLMGIALLPDELHKKRDYEVYKWALVLKDMDDVYDEVWFHIGELGIFRLLEELTDYKRAEKLMANYEEA